MERDSARLLRPTGDDESVAEESTTSMTEIVSTLLSGLCGCCGALGYQKAEAEEKGMDLVPVERRTSGAKAVRAVLEAEDAAEAEAEVARMAEAARKAAADEADVDEERSVIELTPGFRLLPR